MAKDVIIALDFNTAEETLKFLEGFKDLHPYVKIGMELYYAEGPAMVRELKRRGYHVFLDLKLHDIPNTVRKSMKVLAGMGVDICNLHAAGTTAMMRAALEGLTEGSNGGQRPLLIAVTQLTSTSEEVMRKELLIDHPIGETVRHYAMNAREAGLDGVVCSPLEAGIVKEACGSHFLTVTPGVRFADSATDDQSRVTTPARARELGSDYIVVGRPITQAPDPVAAYLRCKKEFLGTEN
ncbi:MAG: orotidine-5'-phosphate decarboxylase [Bacteroidales bacterium]|nr:orotidine-5'-phosphate decarboxylase [Bacteroidales bacterium]